MQGHSSWRATGSQTAEEMFWRHTAGGGFLVHALRCWHVAIALAAISLRQYSGDNDEEDDCKGNGQCDEDYKADGQLAVWRVMLVDEQMRRAQRRNLLPLLKKLDGFSTKTCERLPPPLPLVVNRYGVQVVPLNSAAEALP
jgi:hypothetical protein